MEELGKMLAILTSDTGYERARHAGSPSKGSGPVKPEKLDTAVYGVEPPSDSNG